MFKEDRLTACLLFSSQSCAGFLKKKKKAAN